MSGGSLFCYEIGVDEFNILKLCSPGAFGAIKLLSCYLFPQNFNEEGLVDKKSLVNV